MPSLIDDEFAALPISRQRRYQLRRERDSLCPRCGKNPAGKHGARCRECLCRMRPARQARNVAYIRAVQDFRTSDYVSVFGTRRFRLKNPVVHVKNKRDSGYVVRMHFVDGTPRVRRFFSSGKRNAKFRAQQWCVRQLRLLQHGGLVVYEPAADKPPAYETAAFVPQTATTDVYDMIRTIVERRCSSHVGVSQLDRDELCQEAFLVVATDSDAPRSPDGFAAYLNDIVSAAIKVASARIYGERKRFKHLSQLSADDDDPFDIEDDYVPDDIQ